MTTPANDVCPFGEGDASGSGCIKRPGHDGEHSVTPGVVDSQVPHLVAPNPPSPYATADPNTRHLLPSLFGVPRPGTLAPTGCNRLAVVPAEGLRNADDGTFPLGICDTCITAFYAALRGQELSDDRPTTNCRECQSQTRHDGLCAMCRQDAHTTWSTEETP
ncbi:hypothetical protein AMK17_25260 [Streptomyces sp. CB00072]|uniref:hypothetical protein n=1 Tax=Streptomyces sp. CB00072 TaxID=1703928 RepID=UPI00093A219F|nr:hypothetical protein [Streptomyces sp. CB00072]OKI54317.1 hypothetical protein AMK17_25260 [Streptomyces sp. CB00072]